MKNLLIQLFQFSEKNILGTILLYYAKVYTIDRDFYEREFAKQIILNEYQRFDLETARQLVKQLFVDFNIDINKYSEYIANKEAGYGLNRLNIKEN